MANDSYGFLKGKWVRLNAVFVSGATELLFRLEDETEDTVCGLDAKGGRVVVAKRCIEAAYETSRGMPEIRTERGIDKAASKLRERRRQAKA